MHTAPRLHTQGQRRGTRNPNVSNFGNGKLTASSHVSFKREVGTSQRKAKTPLQASTRADSLGRRPRLHIMLQEPSNSTSLATSRPPGVSSAGSHEAGSSSKRMPLRSGSSTGQCGATSKTSAACLNMSSRSGRHLNSEHSVGVVTASPSTKLCSGEPATSSRMPTQSGSSRL